LKEALAISALGVLGGLLIAVSVRWILIKSWGVALELQAGPALLASVGGLLCGALGALIPSWRAARLEAILALNAE
jgi:ABC-type antimicrobial peptide transport system permease subunit